MKRITIIFFLLTLSLSGCVEYQEIEKLDLINARGVDDAEDGLLETTLVSFQFTGQSNDISNTTSEHGRTLKGTLDKAEEKSVFKMAPGKTKVTIYGKKMAEKGILPLLDTQSRDARINDNMYLAVSSTTAKEILNLNEEQKLPINIGQYLYELIYGHSHDHNFPRETLQNFIRTYYVSGQDNILPLFEINKGRPKLGGIAVFRGDKMVGELDLTDGTFINLINRNVKEERLEISLPLEPFKAYVEDKTSLQHNKLETAYVITDGKSKTKLVDVNNLSYQTKMNIKLRLTEISAEIELDRNIIELLEEEVEKKVKNHFKVLLSKLQDLKADSFGFGRYYTGTKKGKHITSEEWHQMFPKINVDFKVDVEIINHGMEE